MENLEWIFSLALTALSLFVACVSFAVKLVKNVRERIKDKKRDELMESVVPIMEIAENHTQLKGQDKKEYVLEKVSEYAEKNELKYDAQLVADRIEELIEFSKQVNKRT